MSALMFVLLASTTAPDKVVVFPDRAQVTRVTPVSCGARRAVFFENIPSDVAQDAFRARLSEGSIEGLRAELKSRESEFNPKIEALNHEFESVRYEIEDASDQLARAQAQAKVARSYTDIASELVSQEMVSAKTDPKTWQAAFDSALSSSMLAAQRSAEMNAKIRELKVQQEELNRQLAEVRATQSRQSWTVEVLATCPSGKTAQLALTYVVGGASWVPHYEARADESASAVDFSTWATIRQSTGEDWNQVELTLSTAIPSQNATPPSLKVLQLTATKRAPEKKVLVARQEYVETVRAGTSSASESNAQVLARSRGALSVQLQVPEPSRVPGDNAPVRLFVGKSRMKASFELRATPKLMPVAFRIAELTNQAPWPLLPGKVDTFRSTGLVGRHPLERVPQGGAFTLTFGIEDNVRVRRTIMEELKRETGLFNGNKRFVYSYTFELANYGKTSIDVALAEHLPVSEMQDIAVKVSEKTTTGYQLNPQDGIAKWKVALGAGEKKRINFAFQVDVPSSYETDGL